MASLLFSFQGPTAEKEVTTEGASQCQKYFHLFSLFFEDRRGALVAARLQALSIASLSPIISSTWQT